jgi:GTP-binding protein
MLKIASAEFVISAASPTQFPKTSFPEIAFAGRSNVGKSSLLNSLVGRKGLAKISATPGKTRQINFFRINDRFQFADLPGYGYAKVARTEREEWARLIETYLTQRTQLRMVVSLSDIRHEPPALDRDMFTWLEAIGRDFIVVLTKYDKVSPKLAEDRVAELRELTAGMQHCRLVLPFSSQTRFNLDKLVGIIGSVVA